MKDSADVLSAKSEIVLLFCPEAKKLAGLAHIAAEQLEQEGFGKILSMNKLRYEYMDSCRVILIESGYEESCRDLLLEQVKIDHHLVLSDLGLDEDAGLDPENIELVKDGIVAECVIIASQTPKFNCPCCG